MFSSRGVQITTFDNFRNGLTPFDIPDSPNTYSFSANPVVPPLSPILSSGQIPGIRYDLPMSSSTDEKRELLRHTVATLAYRGGKVVRGAAERFADLKVSETTRTPLQILAHIGDLLDWALSMAEGREEWHDTSSTSWSEQVTRFFEGLGRFDAFLGSERPLGSPVEKLFQGPVADALTHVGQLAMLRRIADSPVRGENYFKAEIAVGRVGVEQASPRREFD